MPTAAITSDGQTTWRTMMRRKGRQTVLFRKHSMMVEALREYKKGEADFADCVVGTKSQAAGCRTTAPFDRKAAILGSFKLVTSRLRRSGTP